MTRPYASARRKWERAEQLRHSLEADFLRLDNFQGRSTGLQFDHDELADQVDRGSERLMKFTVRLGADVPVLSDDFPMILGDAIHDYRSALDHLTWELVRRFRTNLNVKDARKVQFPMHNSAREFNDWKGRRTPGVPDKPHRALLKRYQPYRRGEGPKAIRWLRRLSDHDKHRELIPAVIAPKGVLIVARALDPQVRLLGYRALVTGPRAIYPGTPIAEIHLAAPMIRGYQVQVAVDTQFELFPLLNRREHPGGLLAAISAKTLEIIDATEALG
jgi:hypothetical protein